MCVHLAEGPLVRRLFLGLGWPPGTGTHTSHLVQESDGHLHSRPFGFLSLITQLSNQPVQPPPLGKENVISTLFLSLFFFFFFVISN